MNGTDDDDDPENEDSDDEIMDQIQMVNGTDCLRQLEITWGAVQVLPTQI